MKHLSLLTALLLSSSMVYAGWITKGTDYKGDCLEMMCDCVEDSETRDGYCCPDGTAFANTGNPHPTYTPCKCPENLSWDSVSSKCVECLTDHQKDEGACPTPQKPLCINNVCQPCPKETAAWDEDKKICSLPPETQTCNLSGNVKRDGQVVRNCEFKSYPNITYSVSVSGSANLGALFVNEVCILGWKKGRCGFRSSNQSFSGVAQAGKTSASSVPVLVYSNDGGSYNITVTLTLDK